MDFRFLIGLVLVEMIITHLPALKNGGENYLEGCSQKLRTIVGGPVLELYPSGATKAREEVYPAKIGLGLNTWRYVRM